MLWVTRALQVQYLQCLLCTSLWTVKKIVVKNKYNTLELEVPPDNKGCYLLLPKGCPKNPEDKTLKKNEWFLTPEIFNSNINDTAGCDNMKTTLNQYCDIKDAMTYFYKKKDNQ